jgi:hypothetical protein
MHARLRWPPGWSGPGQLQSRAAPARRAQDFAGGGFLAGGFRGGGGLDLVVVAAAVFPLIA